MATDKCIGILALTIAISLITFLFTKLFIIPILPLDSQQQKELLPPIHILTTCGAIGFIFTGSLTVYTFYLLYNKNM